MLSFGRFLVSLVVIVAVFCFAWCIDSPKKDADTNDESITLNSKNFVADGYPTKSNNPPDSQPAAAKSSKSNVWKNKDLDLSKIAIKDPYSNGFSNSNPADANREPPKRMKRIESDDSDSVWNEKSNSETRFQDKSFIVEPPPLVGDVAESDEKPSQQNQQEQPSIPSLLSTQNSPTPLRDPNAPPPPIVEDNSPKRKREIPTKLPIQKETNHAGSQQFVGDLVIVKRKNNQNNKPIGYVKHVWKHGDSLPDLAELYLNDKNRFMEIVAINGEDISNPTKIPVGTVLKIPVY